MVREIAKAVFGVTVEKLEWLSGWNLIDEEWAYRDSLFFMHSGNFLIINWLPYLGQSEF
jgi:hypothetical protein